MKPLLSKEELADLLAPLEPESRTKPGPDQTDLPAKKDRADVTIDKAEVRQPDGDIKSLHEIPLQVRVEVGRTRVLLKELLQIKKGSVLELETSPGEPLDLYVNNHLIARGEAVQIGNKLGIKVTEVAVPTEALNTL